MVWTIFFPYTSVEVVYDLYNWCCHKLEQAVQLFQGTFVHTGGLDFDGLKSYTTLAFKALFLGTTLLDLFWV